MNICEVKYSETEYSLQKDEEAKIRSRMGAYKDESRTKYSLLPVLITTYGLKEGKYSSLPLFDHLQSSRIHFCRKYTKVKLFTQKT